jgi:hypothetical protein
MGLEKDGQLTGGMCSVSLTSTVNWAQRPADVTSRSAVHAAAHEGRRRQSRCRWSEIKIGRATGTVAEMRCGVEGRLGKDDTDATFRRVVADDGWNVINLGLEQGRQAGVSEGQAVRWTWGTRWSVGVV